MSKAKDNSQAAASEVFFDGACPLCRREIALYRDLRGLEDVSWTDVSDPNSALPIDRRSALARLHVKRNDGLIVSGARAFLALWRNSRAFGWLAVLLDRQPFVGVLEIGYRGFLRIRPLWRRA